MKKNIFKINKDIMMIIEKYPRTTMALGLIVFAFIVYVIVSNRSNYSVEYNTKEESATFTKILSSLRILSDRVSRLEQSFKLDKEQNERARKNIYDNMSMAYEARKIDNIAITGLLDRGN